MDLPIDKPEDKKIQNEPLQSPDFAPYPKIDPKDVSPPPPISINNAMESQSQADLSKTKSPSKSVSWSTELTREAPSSRPENSATTMPTESNNNSDYVTASPPLDSQPKSASVTVKDTVNTVKNVLGRWGKKVGETSKKSQDIAGNVWQHLKTGPSFADAAMGRVAQGAKVLAEGGYEKIFRQTFDTVPEEQLQRTYACYLSTSAGPVMGILYISTAKLAFCSDNPLPYKVGEQDEWSYYKWEKFVVPHSTLICNRNIFSEIVLGGIMLWWSSHYTSLRQLIHQQAKLTVLKSTFRLSQLTTMNFGSWASLTMIVL